MHFLFLLGLVPAILFCNVEASSGWDNIPIISQGKSILLLIMNKPNEAKETWDHFKNLSLLWENIKDMDNAIPIYGHGKAIMLLLIGDKENGMDTMAAATNTLATMIGSVAGGPFGGLASSVGSDAFFSLIRKKPTGIVEYFKNIRNKTAGEHIDNAFGISMFFLDFKETKSSAGESGGFKESIGKSSKDIEENIPLLQDKIQLSLMEINGMKNSGKLSIKNVLSVDAISGEWLSAILSVLRSNYKSQGLREGITEISKSIREEYVIHEVAKKKLGGPYTPEEIHVLKTIDENNYLKKYADVAGIKRVDKALKILKNLNIANDIVKKTIGKVEIKIVEPYTLEEIKFLDSIDINVEQLTDERLTALSNQVKLIEEASLIEYKPFKPAPALFTFKELYAMRYELNKQINDIKAGVNHKTTATIKSRKYTLKELKALRKQVNKMIPSYHKKLQEKTLIYSAVELEYMIDTLKDDYLNAHLEAESRKNVKNINKKIL